MHNIQPRMLRYALQLFALLALSNAAVLKAESVKYHTCRFDEIHENDEDDLPTIPLATRQGLEKQNMRVKISTLDLNDTSKYCGRMGQTVTDVFGTQMKCKRKDVLWPGMKWDLIHIVRTAIAMHTERLKVEPLQSNFRVPALTGPLCKMFTVPEEHRTTDVEDADFMLYVASLPSSKEDMFAAGAPCAQIAGGRPVVGALTYTASHIKYTLYSARVAAHEIAHALGFTYAIMQKKFGGGMLHHNVRGKGHKVTEICTTKVSEFTKKQYNCQSPWCVELEDEKGALSVPSHSHWERRNALEELMAGIVSAGYYTYLTLALFHDLGFYEADFNKAEKMDWGTKGGCDFLSKKCIGDGVDNSRYFCSEMNSQKYFCAPGRRAMARCSSLVTVDNLPSAYQYFSDWNRYTGHENFLTDRCPVYEEMEELSCTDPKSKAPGYKGPDSWCLRKKSKLHGDNINGAICAKVYFDTYFGNEMRALEEEGAGSSMCAQKDNYFSSAILIYNKTIHSYECPSTEEVLQHQKMQTLFAKTNATNEFDVPPPDAYFKVRPRP